CSRSSSSAACSSAGDASGSRTASSSVAMGLALANSAASSSFASGVTCDLHVGERSGLVHAQLAEFGELEKTKQGRKDLPGFCSALDELRPTDAGSEREHRANDQNCTGNVERSRNHLVHVRARDRSKDAVHGGEQLGERKSERRLRGDWSLREICA